MFTIKCVLKEMQSLISRYDFEKNSSEIERNGKVAAFYIPPRGILQSAREKNLKISINDRVIMSEPHQQKKQGAPDLLHK